MVAARMCRLCASKHRLKRCNSKPGRETAWAFLRSEKVLLHTVGCRYGAWATHNDSHRSHVVVHDDSAWALR